MTKRKTNFPRHINLYVDKDVYDSLVKMAAMRQLETAEIATISDLVREALASYTNVNVIIEENG